MITAQPMLVISSYSLQDANFTTQAYQMLRKKNSYLKTIEFLRYATSKEQDNPLLKAYLASALIGRASALALVETQRPMLIADEQKYQGWMQEWRVQREMPDSFWYGKTAPTAPTLCTWDDSLPYSKTRKESLTDIKSLSDEAIDIADKLPLLSKSDKERGEMLHWSSWIKFFSLALKYQILNKAITAKDCSPVLSDISEASKLCPDNESIRRSEVDLTYSIQNLYRQSVNKIQDSEWSKETDKFYDSLKGDDGSVKNEQISLYIKESEKIKSAVRKKYEKEESLLFALSDERKADTYRYFNEKKHRTTGDIYRSYWVAKDCIFTLDNPEQIKNEYKKGLKRIQSIQSLNPNNSMSNIILINWLNRIALEVKNEEVKEYSKRELSLICNAKGTFSGSYTPLYSPIEIPDIYINIFYFLNNAIYPDNFRPNIVLKGIFSQLNSNIISKYNDSIMEISKNETDNSRSVLSSRIPNAGGLIMYSDSENNPKHSINAQIKNNTVMFERWEKQNKYIYLTSRPW
jgi:hypothetical protein